MVPRANPGTTVADDDDLEFVDQPRIRMRRSRSSRSYQVPALVSRVCALGAFGTPLAAIDQCLHEEGYVNSKGAPWPRRSDGCVLRRILAGHGIAVPAPAPAAAQGRAPARSWGKCGSAGSSEDGKRVAAAAGRSMGTISGREEPRMGATLSQMRQSVIAVDGCDDFVGGASTSALKAAGGEVDGEASVGAQPRAADASAAMAPMPECDKVDAPMRQPQRSATDQLTGMPREEPWPTAPPNGPPAEATSCANKRPPMEDRRLVVDGSEGCMPELGRVPSDHAGCGTEEDSTSSQQDSPISRARRARRNQPEQVARAGQDSEVSFDAFRASDDLPLAVRARSLAYGLAPTQRLPIGGARPAGRSGGREDALRRADVTLCYGVPPRTVPEAPPVLPAGRATRMHHPAAQSPNSMTTNAEPCAWPGMAAGPGAHALREPIRGSSGSQVELPAASQSTNLHPAMAAARPAPRPTSAPHAAPPASPIASSASSFEALARVAPRVHGRRRSRPAGRAAAGGAPDVDATPAGGRKRTAKRKERPPTSLASEVTQDGSRCQVCSLPWHRSGSHQACTLPCGHLFGRSCIEAELRRRAASTRERCECPICKSTAFVRQVRLVFVTSEAAADEAQLGRRRAELAAELANEEELARKAAHRRKAAEKRIADLRSQWAVVFAARQPAMVGTACDTSLPPLTVCIGQTAEPSAGIV